MSTTSRVSWDEFLKRYMWFDSIQLGLDFSRTTMPLDYPEQKREAIAKALLDMRNLEAGAIANPDENRMVGHYWLRNADLAPTAEIRLAIEQVISDVKAFAGDVHAGRIRGAGGPFKHILLIGIGGSALGPQFVANALSHPKRDKMAIHFLDNTDPDGFDLVFAELGEHFGQTLCIVVSKSGGTKETRNGMLEVAAAYSDLGLEFARHAVAITSEGSELYVHATEWIRTFPMWDWVGGRTSELSAVGLLPAALQGFDIDRILLGARVSDIVSRSGNPADNPALMLAVCWFYIGNGSGTKAMVVLPYKDRLELFSRYLQQLVMESLGKRLNRFGGENCQGLVVYGNKGSTDQHAYVQQLRDGPNNFFCLFISVLQDRRSPAIEVEPSITSGDYLSGFLLGTREALFEQQRESVMLSIAQLDGFAVGVLIALFERAVGYYASLVNVNAYDQPGVEAGKRAANEVLQLQTTIIEFLDSNRGRRFRADEIAELVGAKESGELVFRICEHLSANGRISGTKIHTPTECQFGR